MSKAPVKKRLGARMGAWPIIVDTSSPSPAKATPLSSQHQPQSAMSRLRRAGLSRGSTATVSTKLVSAASPNHNHSPSHSHTNGLGHPTVVDLDEGPDESASASAAVQQAEDSVYEASREAISSSQSSSQSSSPPSSQSSQSTRSKRQRPPVDYKREITIPPPLASTYERKAGSKKLLETKIGEPTTTQLVTNDMSVSAQPVEKGRKPVLTVKSTTVTVTETPLTTATGRPRRTTTVSANYASTKSAKQSRPPEETAAITITAGKKSSSPLISSAPTPATTAGSKPNHARTAVNASESKPEPEPEPVPANPVKANAVKANLAEKPTERKRKKLTSEDGTDNATDDNDFEQSKPKPKKSKSKASTYENSDGEANGVTRKPKKKSSKSKRRRHDESDDDFESSASYIRTSAGTSNSGRPRRALRSVKAVDYAKQLEDDPLTIVEMSWYEKRDQQPFAIVIAPHVPVLLDVHSHLSHNEVIGILAGVWDTKNRTLVIHSAHPCQALMSDSDDNNYNARITVEIDPLSLVNISTQILDSGLIVCGWYHSHPYFKNQPSLTDVDYQAKYQNQLGSNDSGDGGARPPFIGAIITPYGRGNYKPLPSSIKWFFNAPQSEAHLIPSHKRDCNELPMDLWTDIADRKQLTALKKLYKRGTEDYDTLCQRCVSLIGSYSCSKDRVDFSATWTIGRDDDDEYGIVLTTSATVSAEDARLASIRTCLDQFEYSLEQHCELLHGIDKAQQLQFVHQCIEAVKRWPQNTDDGDGNENEDN